MAINVILATQGNSSTSGSSITLAAYPTTTTTSLLVLMVASDNNGTNGSSSILAASVVTGGSSLWGTQYTKNFTPTNSPADGVTVSFWVRRATSISSTNQDTITFSPNTQRKVFQVYEITGVPPGGWGISGANSFPTAGSNSASPSFTLVNTTFNASLLGDVMIGFWGREGFQPMTADSDTLDGTWSAGTNTVTGTAAANSMGLWSQFKIGTYTGSTIPSSQTFNPTATTAASTGDGIPGIIGIQSQQAPPAMAAPTIASVGTFSVNLNWVAPYQHWTISDYVVQYRVVGTSPWSTFTHSPSTTASISVISLLGGTTYEFQIAATNQFGTGPIGAISASATTTGSLNAPTAPVLSTTASALQVSVSSSVTIGVGTINSISTPISPSVAQVVTVPSTTVGTSASIPAVVVTFISVIAPPTIGGVFTPINVGVFTGIRYLRPSGDTSVGSWTVSPLWPKVDESIYDDSDFITSEALTSGTTSIAKLALTLV